MIRILLFLVLIGALALGFSWLADRPGELVMVFGGYRFQVSVLVAAVVIVAIVAVAMLAWWVLKAIWTGPQRVGRYFRGRRRDRGYQALSTGMIAAGAGDAVLAQKMKERAAKLIRVDQEPLLHLLDAQTALLKGDHAAARRRFEAMAADPETRILGLRGLYLEALRAGEREAARNYAEKAVALSPQLEWASEAAMEQRCAEGDWDKALTILAQQKATKQVDKTRYNRRRAVLLTAKALSNLNNAPDIARTSALEAHALTPDFVPAAATAARALIRANDISKAQKILETTWKRNPHPELASLYVAGCRGDGAEDRLKKAQRLEKLHPNHREGALAIARAAIDAGKFEIARLNAEAALRMGPREDVYLVYADIEEVETGNQGRVREWLARAVRAPREAAWVADGYVSNRWLPFSPLDGRIDVFEWKAPVEQEEPADLLNVQLADKFRQEDHRSLTLDKAAAFDAPNAAGQDISETAPAKRVASLAALKAEPREDVPVIIESDVSEDTPPQQEGLRQPDDPGIGDPGEGAEKAVSAPSKQTARGGNLF
ncbi:heme biosynthesis protein HemY [Limoniibacter endophyticus]|uniref:Heme biosynthesis protein HemY n=1 Tax=Limoniibacter endophyticus TaxID=1565040 RepID=A0A8J3DJB5_9HYPH|nr:heme biosynthesis HemY N-terminal domain-containing protein [Limoniibacter endophyticus]GHC73948.1 heme biosynthesis protein HemY [Limoniibacter endophyticus]